jgi:hypothetical protein
MNTQFFIPYINCTKSRRTSSLANVEVSDGIQSIKEYTYIFNWLASLVGIDDPRFAHRGLIVKRFKEQYFIVNNGNSIELIKRG